MYSRTHNPFLAMNRLLRDLDRINNPSPLANVGTYPKVNCASNEHGAVLIAEVPGVDPGSIDVSVQDDTVKLTIDKPARGHEPTDVYHRSERATGQFSREFSFPFRIDGARVKAECRHGVLRVTVEKREADKPRRIPVDAA